MSLGTTMEMMLRAAGRRVLRSDTLRALAKLAAFKRRRRCLKACWSRPERSGRFGSPFRMPIARGDAFDSFGVGHARADTMPLRYFLPNVVLEIEMDPPGRIAATCQRSIWVSPFRPSSGPINAIRRALPYSHTFKSFIRESPEKLGSPHRRRALGALRRFLRSGFSPIAA